MTRFGPTAPGLRGRLLLSVLGALAVVLAALTVGFNLVLADRLDSDANGVAQARAAAELASLRISHGQIVLPEAPDDRSPDIQVWVFQGARPIEQPRTSVDNHRAAATLALSAPAMLDVSATSTRLLSVPVVTSGHRLGAVVAGVSLAPYLQTRRTARVASAILALAVLIAVGLAARLLIDRALRPVMRMTRQAAEWSERDLDRRFALGPARDELTQLGSTLDDLLERLAASLRHEQRLSAEISHELRTPLANIVAEAQYALRHGRQTGEGQATLEHILQSARQLGRTLDTLMAAARAQLDPRGATSDAIAGAHAAVDAGEVRDARPDLEIDVDGPHAPLRVAVEQDLVERILAPLVENAARHAHRLVHVTIDRQGESVAFTVQDDGPGLAATELEAIFEPGHRAGGSGPVTAVALPGAGLGLALCRRLAGTAGGEVIAQPSDAGARFIVRLPAA
jgi:two-component system, OmpR family, sensor kinase